MIFVLFTIINQNYMYSISFVEFCKREIKVKALRSEASLVFVKAIEMRKANMFGSM